MKIALVKLSALGDIIHAMVVLQYIKKNIPNCMIDWFVEERFSQVLHNNPHINTIYTLNLKNNKQNYLAEYKKLKTIAKNNHYELVIDLQGLIKSALVSKILSKNVIGFDKNSCREPFAALFYKQSFAIAYEQNIITRNLQLTCKALGFEMPQIKDKEAFLYIKNPLDIKPTLLVIVGSSWASKIYPKEKFIQIIKALHVETFLSWGDEREREDASFICEHTNATMLPKLTIDELKSVVANSSLLIGADSGPTHMAWALNRPSITIFGPTPSWRNTYVSDINVVVDCEKSIEPKKIDKYDFCIRDINPDTIIKKAKELIKC